MKLNNKGFTTVEVLVCFIVVSTIMVSLFSTVSSFNDRRNEASNRARIFEYKNNITKMIQDDLIKTGLTQATVSRELGDAGSGNTYTVNCSLRDGTLRKLVVYQRFTKSSIHTNGTRNESDEFYIEYGYPSEMVHLDFPNLGETKGVYDDITNTFVADENNSNAVVAKDFQINNVVISVSSDADPSLDGNVLKIFIGFYHPDFGTRYAVNISAPINYSPNNSDATVGFPAKEACSYAECTSGDGKICCVGAAAISTPSPYDIQDGGMTVPGTGQYIVTDINYQANMEVSGEFYTGNSVTSSVYYVGARTGGGGDDASFMISGSTSNNNFDVWYMGNQVTKTTITRKVNKWYTFESSISGNTMTMVITQKDLPSNTATFVVPALNSNSHKLHLYAASSTCKAKAGVKIKNVIIKQNGIITHQFVPAIKTETGEKLFFDLTQKKEYHFVS